MYEPEKTQILSDATSTEDRHQIKPLDLGFSLENLHQQIYPINYCLVPHQTAAIKGLVKWLKTVIDRITDMNYKDIKDRFEGTPLHYAAESGNYLCSKVLLEAGVNCHIHVDVPMYKIIAPYMIGKIAFHHAVVCDQIECFEKLIRFGADVDVKDKYGYTALHYAAKRGSYLRLKMLLEAGANCCIPVIPVDESVRKTAASYTIGVTALHLAAMYNHVECVKELIRVGADIDAKEKFGCTPLHCAADRGSYLCLKVLLEAGANCCIPINIPVCQKEKFLYTRGTTALRRAAAYNHVECVEKLMQYAADCSGIDEDGYSRLRFAGLALAGSGECVLNHLSTDCPTISLPSYARPVCEKGKLLYSRGTTALHLAAAFDHVECVEELIKFGADCGAVDEDGYTSLHIAALAGSSECVLNHLRNADCSTFLSLPSYASFDTPLHFAVENRMLECIKELVHLGSDVNHLNGEGLSPLHLLCSTYEKGSDIDMEILKILVLESRDVDVNKTTGSGVRALYFSLCDRCHPMTAFLITHGADGADVNLVKGGLTFLETELIINGKLDSLKYFVKCMPQLPRLKSLNVDFPMIEIHKEYFSDENGIWTDVVLPDNGKFWLRRIEMQVYVEIYNNGVRRMPRDRDVTDFVYVPYYVCYPLQQPLLNLIYERVIDELNYMSENPDKEIRDSFSHFSKSDILILKKQLWYEKVASAPRTLQHYCRFSIRKCMGPSRLKHIRKLPLPEKLLSYLMFECDE